MMVWVKKRWIRKVGGEEIDKERVGERRNE